MSNGIFYEKADEHLRRIQTAESVFLPISREAFEKLYLSPKTPTVVSDLRKKVANPTPIALLGFLLASTPNACITMGWGGAGGNGAAIIPVFIFFGGFVQVLGAIGEWMIGNTFSCVLFFTYGAFWLAQGAGMMPFFATGTHLSPTGNFLEGQKSPMYDASLGFFFVCMTVITFIYMIGSIRTNICLLSTLVMLVIAFGLLAGTHFALSYGNVTLAEKVQMAAGAFSFALCIPVWWIFMTQILEAVDFPISLPVGDLSTVVPGRSQRAAKGEVEP
ncbi:putative plasma membrane ammonium transporter (Ato3) [Aspergillus clavatus NRRL 1]|uniref:Plasma membrane ammonium transporter (Ato3), putative n=1 Tax=Aspergillus clavatus (strain ATCC 1007 / CBS 513.65 / DSM 816 / NCTC 3887 / NRRL 1 / QM 1276 / 107) TaxID=344612 RepID=A1C5N2_ASPCL|nr:plasma membrane ammonium transporter (Ato3), putative [Aspergillus clavatus NRRL 1]EAW15000.1 plasma membrane ammonium transporter (Ato3), putative [Aspergillus clavatus NRRL 1]